jgi:hypothetical protein
MIRKECIKQIRDNLESQQKVRHSGKRVTMIELLNNTEADLNEGMDKKFEFEQEVSNPHFKFAGKHIDKYCLKKSPVVNSGLERFNIDHNLSFQNEKKIDGSYRPTPDELNKTHQGIQDTGAVMSKVLVPQGLRKPPVFK